VVLNQKKNSKTNAILKQDNQLDSIKTPQIDSNGVQLNSNEDQ